LSPSHENKNRTPTQVDYTGLKYYITDLHHCLTFSPGFLMSLDWLPWNMTVFYLYFANNVANPVIYSFMNQNFRADLRNLVCKGKSSQQRRSLTTPQK